jgi:aminoglycoside phosphotransferase (APT) family kinase protein
MTTADPYAIVADRVAPGARVTRRAPLRGGVSASVEALELASPDGSSQRVVVRRPGAAEWKELETESPAATEFALLRALGAAGMAVPAPRWLDVSSEVLPWPFYVMDFVEGATAVDAAGLPAALRQMAEYLARLHALDRGGMQLPALPRRDDPMSGALTYLAAMPEAEAIVAALRGRGAVANAVKNAPALLHGDYWPGNVIWKDGAIAAVIDWEDAAIGDPLADLAGARVELLWRHGEEAMDAFTSHYLAFAAPDVEHLPLWDLYVTSAGAAYVHLWGLDPAVEADMRSKTSKHIARAGCELA